MRCACAIADEIRPLGIEVRAGLHTGECEVTANLRIMASQIHNLAVKLTDLLLYGIARLEL